MPSERIHFERHQKRPARRVRTQSRRSLAWQLSQMPPKQGPVEVINFIESGQSYAHPMDNEVAGQLPFLRNQTTTAARLFTFSAGGGDFRGDSSSRRSGRAKRCHHRDGQQAGFLTRIRWFAETCSAVNQAADDCQSKGRRESTAAITAGNIELKLQDYPNFMAGNFWPRKKTAHKIRAEIFSHRSITGGHGFHGFRPGVERGKR